MQHTNAQKVTDTQRQSVLFAVVQFMAERGMDAKDFSAALYWPEGKLGEIIRGRQALRMRDVQAMANFMFVPMETLLRCEAKEEESSTSQESERIKELEKSVAYLHQQNSKLMRDKLRLCAIISTAHREMFLHEKEEESSTDETETPTTHAETAPVRRWSPAPLNFRFEDEDY